MTLDERNREAERVAAWVARQSAVNTNPPAGYEADCPQCGNPSHASLVAAWGRCMACQNKRRGK